MFSPITIINTAINSVLVYDAGIEQQLSDMEGRSLCLNLKNTGISLIFKVQNRQLILDDKNQACQVTLTATPQEIIELWQTSQQGASVNLEITGNPLALQDFSNLFKHLNIDWEAIIESAIGSLPSQIVSRTIKSSSMKLKTFHEKFISPLKFT